jgi:hypothetical protein
MPCPPRTGGDLRGHCGSGVLAEVLGVSEDQRQSDSEVHALTALQGAEGGGADPRRASRRGDAQYFASRGDRETLSRATPGDRQCTSDPILGQSRRKETRCEKAVQAVSQE